MTPRTRKLLTAAALATAFIAGPAAAHEGAAQVTTTQVAAPAAAPAAAPETNPRAQATLTRAARRTMVARAVKSVETAARMITQASESACRIGNGKGPMYSESLYECVTAAGAGNWVVVVDGRGSR